ncbi:hypothetical protein Hte_008530 [Hypoxylon texense]
MSSAHDSDEGPIAGRYAVAQSQNAAQVVGDAPERAPGQLDLQAVASSSLELLATFSEQRGGDAGAAAPIPSAELGGGAAAVPDAGDAGVAAPAVPAMPAPGGGRQLRSGARLPDLQAQRQPKPRFVCARCGHVSKRRGHAVDHENTHVPGGGPCLWPGCTNALPGAGVDAVKAHIRRDHVKAVGRFFQCQWEDGEGVHTHKYDRKAFAERRAIHAYHDRAMRAGLLFRAAIVQAAAAEEVEEEEDQDMIE